jgi:tripartite-type tricarboxylate transporter receptor subunit TctC
MPQLVVETWNALFVPARTPADVVAKLSDAAREALKDPQVARQLQDMGARVVGSTPAELAAFNEAEVRRWAPVVKASGATAD